MSASTAAAAAESDRDREAAFLRADLERTQRELRQVQESFDEYTQSSHELEQELEQELARAEARSALLGGRAQQLERDLDSAREKLESALQQAHTFERELGTLRAELALALEAKRRLEQEQDDLVTHVRILQATEEDLRHKMEREMEEKVFLVSDQEELQREHELAVERFRTEIVDLKSELYALQQKLSDDDGGGGGGEKRDQLQRSAVGKYLLESSSFGASALGIAEASGSGSEGADPEDSDDAFVLRRSTVHERDVESQEVLIASLQREIDVLSARAQEETEARERLEAELIRIQDSVAHVASMESELLEMSDEVLAKTQAIRTRDVEEQVRSLKLELATLTQTSAEQSATGDELRALISERLAEIESLRHALADAEARCNELSEYEIRLTSRLESEVELVAGLRAQLQAAAAGVADEARLRNELEQQIQASQSEISQNREEVKALQDANAALRERLESAARKAAELERLSSTSTASTSSTTSSGDAAADAPRLLFELQSLRAKLNALNAENARLRSQEGIAADVASNKQISANLLTINYSGEQLARKYLAERARNASLLSRLQTVCGNIQVFCRVRPVIYEELQKAWGARLAVNVINHSDVAVLDLKAERNMDGSIDVLALESLESGASWKVFTFDRILGPEETQNDVFREVEPIAHDPGLNYRVVRHIFQSIQLRGSIYNPELDGGGGGGVGDTDDMDEKDPEAEDDVDMVDHHEDSGRCYQVQVGVLEIYNETLRDLISVDNSKALEIRHDSESGDIHVADLTMATVSSPEQTIEVLRKAHLNRVTGQTNVHARSSRSHCVVVVQIVAAANGAGNANEASDELIVKNKKDILSAKRAFSEIQSLKQQLQLSARKCKQAQQSVVALRREQKTQSEKQAASLQSRIKTSESHKSTFKAQNEALKRLHDEMGEQLRLEREARQREADQREAAQRMLRQLTAKSRVSSSHQESVEALLKDREAEIKKLRHLLTEARQRSTTALIPRLGSPALSRSGGVVNHQQPPPQRTNQEADEAEAATATEPGALAWAAATRASAKSPPAPSTVVRKRNPSSFLASGRQGGLKPRPTEAGDGGGSESPTSGASSTRARRASSLRATATIWR
ncbi:hypothetical protein PybrP1_012598 [[Pythium] brassicae (nom. inval.)]|nr:hypothetical protein PybrP1_012598 [[Pythium] brassicae (nom. inval.)]